MPPPCDSCEDAHEHLIHLRRDVDRLYRLCHSARTLRAALLFRAALDEAKAALSAHEERVAHEHRTLLFYAIGTGF